MKDILFCLLAIVISYGLGSIPSGLLLSRYIGSGEDLRKKGSGNIGATNAFRVGGKLLGALTLIADFAKGYIAAMISLKIVSGNLGYLPAFFATIGHVFPVWLKFKGGKGVATSMGIMMAVNFAFGAFTLWAWVMILVITHISSLASLLSILIMTLASMFFLNIYIFLLYLALFVIVVYKHIPNIHRLLNREESKIINF